MMHNKQNNAKTNQIHHGKITTRYYEPVWNETN